MLAAGDGFAQRLIVRKAGFVEYDYFAVNDGILDAKAFCGTGQIPVFCRPIVAVAREDAHVMIDDDLAAIAVELDFVNPFVAFGRLLDQGRQQRLDEL
ncbi:hypothetical protein X761_29160 [Mesorhizobium sp. LSHC424B00]|nr:hypothetical protein X761_29160 [Mesorhizobium sp. LSHC424B00]